MAPLIFLDRARRDRELAGDNVVASGVHCWRFGALALVLAYVLPFFRLIASFLRHADQF